MSGSSIRLVNPDGTAERRLLDDAGTSTLSWSPDGSMLAFTKLVTSDCPEGEVDVHLIYVVSIRGGSPRPVSRDACNGGDQAPDWHR
jgi:Tol biopolymer transport system component